MSANLPEHNDASTRRDADGADQNASVPGSLETFEIDVAAANSTQLERAGILGMAPTPPIGLDSPSTPTVTPKTEIPEGILVTESPEQPMPATELAPTAVRLETDEEQQPQPVKVVRRLARQSSWWLSSLGLHAVVLIGLAFATLALPREDEIELYASPAVYEPLEEEVFEDLEIDLSEELDTLEEELDEPDPAPLEDLAAENLFEDSAVTEASVSETANSEATEDLSELSDLFGASGTGLAGMDSEIGTGAGAGMAKFFGTEIKARRILYMLDNSGGMRRDGKFEALVSELKRSISELGPKQEFYVIFYSDTVYPLFYPQGVRKFVRPNDRNKKLLERWLPSVELCVGNAIDEALAAAEVIRPEAVFLLTDGDLFTTAKKKALLLNAAGRTYSIHTFGLGVGATTKTANGLRQVAEANSGTFQAIQVTAEMEALAQETQRPYHNKEPGLVWGLKVGRR